MANLVTTHANALLDASMDQSGASVRLATNPIHVRLMTTNGSASAAGTEVASGGGYTAAATGATHSVTFAAASGGTKASNSTYTVSNYPRAETVVGVELWDNAGTPSRLWFGALTASKTMNAGDTFTINSGSLQLTLG